MSESTCFHCGLPVTAAARCTAEIEGEPCHFCCAGCMAVCQSIHEAGLEGFYQRLNFESSESPPPQAPGDLDQYDLPEVQAEFVQRRHGISQAHLLIEGIHCAACVWLIEHALNAMAGIESAEVNLAHHRLNLRWREDQVRLSAIMGHLARIGYAAAPFDPERAEGSMLRSNRSLLFRMSFAGFGAMNIMWISIALFAGAFSGIEADLKHYFHWISFFIATPVLLYSGWPFISGAVRGLLHARLTMDLPIAIGSLVTWGYSCWVMASGSLGEVYFDTVTSFLFVILIGRYLEGLSRRNASSAALRLMELQPRLATRLSETGEERIAVRKLQVGDRVRVGPGDKIPVDGIVVAGESWCDESMLSGEARPLHKLVGADVVAGAMNVDGSLTIEVQRTGAQTALAHIVALVEEAQGSKANVQRIADRIVPWFVAATIGLSLATFAFWIGQDFDKALLAAVSVLIITCPCALGLATPMGIAVGVGAGAARGVLVRNGQALETLSSITHVVFDKTGTLTEGRMRVLDVELLADMDWGRVMQFAASVEAHSRHPLALAICDAAKELPLSVCEDFHLISGMGVSGDVGGHRLAIGNPALMQAVGITIPESLFTRMQTIEAQMGLAICVAMDGQLLALISLQDQLRPESVRLVDRLRAQGIGMTILTGDSAEAANALAELLGGIEVAARLKPEDKDAAILRLQANGERVLMIGDGVNDAPALARADVSMAMGSGMDVSKASADIVLVGSDLSRVGFAVQLAGATLSAIRQNIAISLLYNLTLVPMAMAAMVTPLFAAVAMPVSSMLVIGNALLIRRRIAGKGSETVAGDKQVAIKAG